MPTLQEKLASAREEHAKVQAKVHDANGLEHYRAGMWADAEREFNAALSKLRAGGVSEEYLTGAREEQAKEKSKVRDANGREHCQKGRWADAEREFEAALSQLHAAGVSADPKIEQSLTSAREEQAKVHEANGLEHYQAGMWADAEREFEAALSSASGRQERRPHDRAEPEQRSRGASQGARRERSRHYRAGGVDAAREFEAALTKWSAAGASADPTIEETLASTREEQAKVHDANGLAHYQASRWADAEREFEAALSMLQKAGKSADPEIQHNIDRARTQRAEAERRERERREAEEAERHRREAEAARRAESSSSDHSGGGGGSDGSGG